MCPMPERGLREIKKEATAQSVGGVGFRAGVGTRHGWVCHCRCGAARGLCPPDVREPLLLQGGGGGIGAVRRSRHEVAAFIADLPEGTSLLDALHELLRSQMSAEMFEGAQARRRCAGSTPPWSRTSWRRVRHMRQTTPEAWSEFTEGRYSDQYIHVLLAAVYGAVSLLFDGSLDVLPPGQPATGEIRSRDVRRSSSTPLSTICATASSRNPSRRQPRRRPSAQETDFSHVQVSLQDRPNCLQQTVVLHRGLARCSRGS